MSLKGPDVYLTSRTSADFSVLAVISAMHVKLVQCRQKNVNFEATVDVLIQWPPGVTE